MSKIGIVTVLYNSETVLDDFFRTLDCQTYKNFTLYIIDNASTDNGLDKARKLSLDVSFDCIFIPEKTNWGIAKGNNIGIKRALQDGVDYVLLSNNDIILDKFAIENLLNGIIKYKSTLIVPKIYYSETNIIWQAGGHFDIFRGTTPHVGNQEVDNGQYNSAREFDYSSTCFMMIKSDVFGRVGFMDESYFVYYDDSDFVYRCTKLGNEKLYYSPESVVYHKVSVSTEKGSDFFNRMMFRNRVLFIRKNYTKIIKPLTILNLLLYHFIIHPFKMTKTEFRITTNAIFEGLKIRL